MSHDRQPATRQTLLRLRRRLAQVDQGARLLRRKRETLAAELFRTVRPAIGSRQQIEGLAASAYEALLSALADNGAASLRAMAWPERELRVDLEVLEAWGVRSAGIVRLPPLARDLGERGVAPVDAEAVAVEAALRLEVMIEKVLQAAPKEVLLRRLGNALLRTTRQVNTLEQRLTPQLEGALARTRQAIDEREREEQLRLKRLLRRWRGPGA